MKKSKKGIRPRRLIEFPDEPAIIVDPEGQVLVGVQYVPLVTFADDVRDDYYASISDDQCCKDNPLSPRVKIESVRLSQDRASLVVDVAASHACGIESVIVYAGDVVTKEVKPGIFRREFVAREAGGKKIGDMKPFSCADKITSVNPQLNIPAADLAGKAAFQIIAYAYDCCDHTPGIIISKATYSL
jgi:hypothetical protein